MNEGLVLHIVLEDIGKGAPVFSLHAQSGVDDINYSLLITQHCNFAGCAPAVSSQHTQQFLFI